MAEAAAQGAQDFGRLLEAERAEPADVLAASGLLFVCPENLGTMSGEMKAFFDRTYYPLLGRIEGRAFASAIAAGSAGDGAQAQLERIVTGWRLRRVAEPLIVRLGVQEPAAILAPKVVPATALATCRDLGQALAEGLAQGIF